LFDIQCPSMIILLVRLIGSVESSSKTLKIFKRCRINKMNRYRSAEKILPAIMSCLLFFMFAVKPIHAEVFYPCSDTLHTSETCGSNTYRDIAQFKDKFIAVGTNGRIDGISPSGEIMHLNSVCQENLNSAYSNGEIFLTVGDHGIILYSKNGTSFSRAVSGTGKNILGISGKNGLYVAGADSGTILISNTGVSWKSIPTTIRGKIVSITATNSCFFGVTDSGEIIKSFDGLKWDIQNYNREYAGYNQYSIFRKIVASPNSITIIGIHKDGSPSIICSSLGNVWAERPPIYQDDQGVVQGLTNKPNGIAYDPDRDQFVVACDNGELLALPPCAKCNKWEKISEKNLQAICYFDNYLLIVGEEFSVSIQRVR
jgi:hypothetical protein